MLTTTLRNMSYSYYYHMELASRWAGIYTHADHFPETEHKDTFLQLHIQCHWTKSSPDFPVMGKSCPIPFNTSSTSHSRFPALLLVDEYRPSPPPLHPQSSISLNSPAVVEASFATSANPASPLGQSADRYSYHHWVCAHIHMHTHRHACTCTGTHTYACTHAQAHTHISTHIYACTHRHAHTQACMHTHRHTHICMHMHMHAPTLSHTRTHLPMAPLPFWVSFVEHTRVEMENTSRELTESPPTLLELRLRVAPLFSMWCR